MRDWRTREGIRRLDEWKTRTDDPSSLGRSEPRRYRCLECEWQGRNLEAWWRHQRDTGHQRRGHAP